MPSAAFLAEMDKKRGTFPRTKIEFIDKSNVTTDISGHFLSGANFEQTKERAPDEIQAGQFDIVLTNEDDTFSEYVEGSLIEDGDYHGARIRVSQGFLLPDGTTEYLTQGIGYIDQLIASPRDSTVTLRCRDLLWRIMDQKIHVRPENAVPLAGSNTGDGHCTQVDTKPFAVINQNWTLTCTLAGTDGVATFSVVGSVSGNIGTATSGTEFTSNTYGIKFTIKAGAFPWALADSFTFSTYQHPQWSFVNAGKIIWSILTGYNYDTDTAENWAGRVFDFDSTQSSSNTDLDYDSFVTAIADINAAGVFDLKGFANFDTDAVAFLQEILTLVLGSLYTGADGRIKFKVYQPTFGTVIKLFSDADKIVQLGYNRTVDEIINSVTVYYIATDNFLFSDQQTERDGVYVKKDSTSVTNYKELGQGFNINWHTANGAHVQDFADKLVARYSKPPLNVLFETGMDALEVEIGDYISVTDTKYGLNAIVGEVATVKKKFDNPPTGITLLIRRDAVLEQVFGLVGSSIDEGDGLSPQSDDYDTATVSDKQFTYVGNATPGDPDYRIY